ncbi:MAG: dihydropteroate synthase, partial [Opitutales bacterium]|nr:dihydropteroate synthase [Opitutales bacterium]
MNQNAKSVKIMGILNLTPDSFSDGGKFCDVESAVNRAAQMLEEGADILDLGAESTRPGAAEVPAEEELGRLLEPLRQIRKSFPKASISVDTYKGEVARRALEEGADIINDVWGGMWG